MLNSCKNHNIVIREPGTFPPTEHAVHFQSLPVPPPGVGQWKYLNLHYLKHEEWGGRLYVRC